MDWQDRLNRAMAWIEAHLCDELDWGVVAREANCSEFHFSRMFEVIMGLTVGDYVRRRRLSLAASELALGRSKVIDVALKYGYDSPDAFAKAFRRLFGCTPSEAREGGRTLSAYPPISFSIVLKGDMSMNYRIETKPAFGLTGPWIRTSSDNGVNFRTVPEFWARIMGDGTWQRLMAKVPPDTRIGVCGVCAEYDVQANEFSYLAAIETPADRGGLPEGCKDIMVPGATWGIFESRGPLPAAMQEVWKRIFTEWFPSSGWECADGPQLELYAPGDPQSADYYSEIWIPLRRPS
jgi:AraC family transcriptional regulator